MLYRASRPIRSVGRGLRSFGRGNVAPGGLSALGSLAFYVNSPAETGDYATLATIPPDFGTGEFTFECTIRLNNTSPLTTGPGGGTSVNNWATDNPGRYSGSSWWFNGNFLLDGHNNQGGAYESGTFSLQVFGCSGATGANLRWTFGDGSAAAARNGRLHACESSGLQLRDALRHKVACVRRWDGGTGSILELWIDGTQVGSETSTLRTNMQSAYWSSWTGYPAGQGNWCFGAEKNDVISGGGYWDDYKGLVSDLRFYNRAKSSAELAQHTALADPADSSLVGLFRCAALDGNGRTYDHIGGTRYIQTVAQSQGAAWVSEVL